MQNHSGSDSKALDICLITSLPLPFELSDSASAFRKKKKSVQHVKQTGKNSDSTYNMHCRENGRPVERISSESTLLFSEKCPERHTNIHEQITWSW